MTVMSEGKLPKYNVKVNELTSCSMVFSSPAVTRPCVLALAMNIYVDKYSALSFTCILMIEARLNVNVLDLVIYLVVVSRRYLPRVAAGK